MPMSSSLTASNSRPAAALGDGWITLHKLLQTNLGTAIEAQTYVSRYPISYVSVYPMSDIFIDGRPTCTHCRLPR